MSNQYMCQGEPESCSAIAGSEKYERGVGQASSSAERAGSGRVSIFGPLPTDTWATARFQQLHDSCLRAHVCSLSEMLSANRGFKTRRPRPRNAFFVLHGTRRGVL